MSRAKHIDAAMEKLYPTKTRLELLAAVERGEVQTVWGHVYMGPQRVRVDARLDEVGLVGWVKLAPYTDRSVRTRTWKLTKEGSRVLRTYGGTDG